MLQDLISLDQQLLLALNGSDSAYLDGVWVAITTVLTWVPFYLSILYVFMRSYEAKQVFIILLMVGLAILLADQMASGICKPYFQRFRPTHEPLLVGLVDIVPGHVGGRYGFMSSHAANGFAICTFISLIIRHRWLTVTMVVYASLSSFSRIYLGMHYPGDILCGGLWGVISAFLIYWLYLFLQNRFLTARKFYSSAYTRTGIVKEDAHVPIFTYFLTLIGVFIFAIFYAANH